MAFPTTSLPLARALVEREYNDPTPVQVAVLDAAAMERDLLVSAQTGSGKTVAYGLAIASTLLGDAVLMGAAAAPQALIVAPTRELALQVHRELSWLYAHAGATVVSCVGGMDPRREARSLADGAHIVVGTPGRLRDHLERGALDLTAVRAVVLDEADEMLDLGFREDLEFLLDATPESRRTLLFSATLPAAITALAKRYQRDAVRIEVSAGKTGHADIEYRAIRVAANQVEHAVVNVLRLYEAPSAIVFCSTRDAVRHLHAILLERGFAAVALSGELSQAERNRALQALRDGRARVCVATDVAARGIDLPSLGLVVHADLPQNSEVLQHRSGRTGRAGRKGTSVLLVPPSRRRRAELLLGGARVQVVWSGPPSAEEIGRLDRQRLLTDPIFAEESDEDDLAMAKALLAERSPEDIAAALARLYRSRFPAPEELSDPGDGRDRRSPREDRHGAPRHAASGHDRASGRNGASGDGVWFRLDIGREKNADPRWLLPMLCRRGQVTRQEIGAIRIFDRETKFEIASDAAARFAAAVRRSGPGDGHILPVDAGPAGNRYERPRSRRPAEATRPVKRTGKPDRPKRLQG